MCFGGGGGKSADDYYKDLRAKTPKPELPSLRNVGEKTDRPEQVLSDVKRKGTKSRSLLLMGGTNAS